MATFKKTAKKSAKKSTRGPATAGDAGQAQAERLSKSLSESAQQIWLAGVGAFGRAQSEGTRLFEGLVKEGLGLENTARRFAGKRADVVRDAVENRVDQARERASDTWDRLEKVFESRVQSALVKLGVPGREDLRELSARVDALTAELRRQRGPAARAASGKPAARRAPASRPASATAAKAPGAPRKRAVRTAE